MRPNRVSCANVASTLALVVALGGGTAYAVNTVRSIDIVDGEVKQVDLASNAVTGAKVKNNTLGADDIEPAGVGASELDADSVGFAELQVGVLPAFTYQRTVASASSTQQTKEITATCDTSGQSTVTGGGFVVSPNITGFAVQRSYAVSANTWLVRVTAANTATSWQLTVVANCIQ